MARPVQPEAPPTPLVRGWLRPPPAGLMAPGGPPLRYGVDWSSSPSKSTIVVFAMQPDKSIHVIATSDMECGNNTTGGQDF